MGGGGRRTDSEAAEAVTRAPRVSSPRKEKGGREEKEIGVHLPHRRCLNGSVVCFANDGKTDSSAYSVPSFLSYAA